MPVEYVERDQPERLIRFTRIGCWTEPWASRFPLLPPERRAEIRRQATEKALAHREAERRQSGAPLKRFAAPRPQPAASYTYLVAAEGSNFVKIGWAKEPWKRVAYLQTGSPVALSVIWKEEGPYETPLHQEFAKYRVRGEWFDFTEVGNPVEAVKAAVERIRAAEVQADEEQ